MMGKRYRLMNTQGAEQRGLASGTGTGRGARDGTCTRVCNNKVYGWDSNIQLEFVVSV